MQSSAIFLRNGIIKLAFVSVRTAFAVAASKIHAMKSSLTTGLLSSVMHAIFVNTTCDCILITIEKIVKNEKNVNSVKFMTMDWLPINQYSDKYFQIAKLNKWREKIKRVKKGCSCFAGKSSLAFKARGDRV